jgi:hypothetical protein
MPTDRPRDNRSGSRDAGRATPKGAPSKSPRKGGKSDKGRKPDSARDARGPRREDDRRPPGPDLAGPSKWGRIARGGAGRMDSPAIGTEAHDDFPQKRRRPPKDDNRPTDSDDGNSVAETEAPVERTPPAKPDRNLPTADDLQQQTAKAVRRSRGPRVRDRKPLGGRAQRAEDPSVALKRLVGPQRSKSLQRNLRDAGTAFESERFGDARALLQPVIKEAPEFADGRELMGLTHYRLGKWKEAIDQLEAFRELTHSTEQHPVLMDCHRALGRWRDVEELWLELGEVSPNSELVTEGRIVVAGGQADQGELTTAIRTLELDWKLPRRPEPHHLRRAYALADLYDRAGKAARAREVFKWVATHDPQFADVRTRVKALS